MFLFTHVATGIAIGLSTPDPASSFLLGLGSHAVLDSIPHIDVGQMFRPGIENRETTPRTLWEWVFIVLDFVLSVSLLGICWYIGRGQPSIIAGAFGAFLPDSVYLPIIGERIKNLPIMKQIDALHNVVHYRLPDGLRHQGWFAPAAITIMATAMICLHLIK